MDASGLAGLVNTRLGQRNRARHAAAIPELGLIFTEIGFGHAMNNLSDFLRDMGPALRADALSMALMSEVAAGRATSIGALRSIVFALVPMAAPSAAGGLGGISASWGDDTQCTWTHECTPVSCESPAKCRDMGPIIGEILEDGRCLCVDPRKGGWLFWVLVAMLVALILASLAHGNVPAALAAAAALVAAVVYSPPEEPAGPPPPMEYGRVENPNRPRPNYG